MTDWGALFRSHTPTDTTDTIDKTPAASGCVNSVNCVTGASDENPRSAVEPATLSAADWRAEYDECAGIAEFDGHRSRADAERMAWLSVANRWYCLHGEPVPAALCAGCRRPLSGSEVLLLPHGERAHVDADHGCIIAYGRRWKVAAAAALETMGIPTPLFEEADT
jgi:hypothetical protein